MDLSLPGLLAFVRETLEDPRAAARRAMAIEVPMSARWIALAIVTLGSTIVLGVGMLASPQTLAPAGAPPMPPFASAIVGFVVAVASVVLMHRVGLLFGGTGTLPAALSATVWLQFVLLIAQAAMVAVIVVLPPLAALAEFAVVALTIWLLTNFVAELHGFRSRLATLLGVLGVGMLLGALLFPLFVAPG
jgi:hypothetical protein